MAHSCSFKTALTKFSDYQDALMKSSEAAEGVSIKQIGPDTSKKSIKPFPAITAPSRRLAIAAKSTKLARFDETMRRLGMNTLVKDMEGIEQTVILWIG